MISAPEFDNSYARELPGTYLECPPQQVPAPRLVRWNADLAQDLGFAPDLPAPIAAEMFSGNRLPAGARPLAQAYAGHQFGGFSPQLGDGRAVLLGEVIDRSGQRRDIALKGSGRTPFSRGGDGKAALGPVLREYLVGEAMHALGVPTTRALAAVVTGETVMRDRPLPGAVLTRVAASHLRVGTFQFFAARKDTAQLKALADHAIVRHYPACAGAANPYLAFFDAVTLGQARLVAQWMGLGFIHGVMNTDNMTISGETIDYGPCAFMDSYAPGTVFSSIDHGGRYAYANQPLILGWNLARLAEALLPLFAADQEQAVSLANDRLDGIAGHYAAAHARVMAAKLGLAAPDPALTEDFLALLDEAGADWTRSFRALNDAVLSDRALLAHLPKAGDWLARWTVARSPDAAAIMARANPVYIPRNHLVEAALAAAELGDMGPFERLLSAITDPFTERPGFEDHALPAPTGFGPYRTFCGT
jgi:serine/tyrosine/threonine adenylyltransferase